MPPDLAGDHVLGRSVAKAAQEALVRIEANSLKTATSTQAINAAMDTYVLPPVSLSAFLSVSSILLAVDSLLV